MSDRLGILSWSFPIGRLFATQVRVSPLILLMAGVLAYRLGWQVGLVFSAMIFLAILLHEFGHIFAARFTGGAGDEILLWPLGGLAFVQPGPGLGAAVQTILAGPLVNLVLAVALFPGFYVPLESWAVLNPFVLHMAPLSGSGWWQGVLLLAFTANWILFLVNLLPMYPLDGGQLVSAVLASRMPGEDALRITALVGSGTSLLIMAGGLMFDHAWLVAIGAFALILNLRLTTQIQSGESYDDSFMGYDFSQGYTSLEKSDKTISREPRQTWLQAWKARRTKRQHERDVSRRKDLERQLDELLAKVHEHGMDSLSAAEKLLLRKASDELRHRSRPGEP